MSDLWQRLSEKKNLDEALRLEIEESFGNRGKKALAALDDGRIKKYLDFFVVQGGLQTISLKMISAPAVISCSGAGPAGTCWQSGLHRKQTHSALLTHGTWTNGKNKVTAIH